MKPARISRDAVHKLCRTSPRRRIMEDNSIISPSRNERYNWYVKIPFSGMMFFFKAAFPEIALGVNDDGSYWCGIHSDEEIELIRQWEGKYSRFVFLRCLFESMIALRMYSAIDGGSWRKTRMGEAIYKLKYGERSSQLLDRLGGFIGKKVLEMPLYKDADAIVCIPPTNPNSFCLPLEMSKRVAKETGKKDFSGVMFWKRKRHQTKELSWDERWDRLEESKLSFHPELVELVEGKKILLLDDVYQTGVSMHYVAMELINKGAKSVFGLAAAKDLTDGIE